MSGAAALDHVGVVTRDLTTVAKQFEHLGFMLTPFARQSDGRIGNRCAMLRQGYIELLAVVDANARSATLERFLARYAGIHILAFSIDDPETELVRLRRAGVEAPAISRVDRLVDDADPTGLRARFALIPLLEQPEGRLNLVHHRTPEALWQERFLHHPNNATALVEVDVVVGEPAESAARFSRLVGRAVVPDPAGGFALDLPRGRVRLLPGTALDGGEVPGLPSIVGMTIHTADANAAVLRLLAERGIAHRIYDGDLLVDPSEAGGVALRFSPAA